MWVLKKRKNYQNCQNCGFYCKGICCLMNKRWKKIGCKRYFIPIITGLLPKDRLKIHSMHKQRQYSSIAFIASLLSAMIAILALIISITT